MNKSRLILLLLLLTIAGALPAAARGSFMARYWDPANNSLYSNKSLFDVNLALQVNANTVWVMGHSPRMDSFYVMSVTPNGSPIYTHRFANKNFAYNTQAVVSTSGMVFILFVSAQEDTLTIWKMSPSGSLLLTKTYLTPTTVHFGALAPTADRGFIAGGGGCVGFNYFMCLDSNANILWNKNYTPGGTNDAPIIWKIESIDGGTHFRAWGGTTLGGFFSMTNIDKTGPAQITYRKYWGYSGAASLYTNVCRSAVRRDRYFVHVGSYPVQGMNAQAGNQFSVAYSDTLGNLKWMKLIRLPDTSIFYLQNSYSVPTRDGGVLTVSCFGNQSGANAYKQYNVYIKMDSLGRVVKQMKGAICDTINESAYAFTPIAGDTSFMVVNRASSAGSISMGRVTHSLQSICNQKEYQCAVFDNMPISVEDVLAYGYDHTYRSVITETPAFKNITASRQYYCSDTVAMPAAVPGSFQRADIRLYPNPATGSLHVVLPANMGDAMILLLSTTGQAAQAPLPLHSGDNLVNVTGLAAGLYAYRIAGNDGLLLQSGILRVGEQ